MKSEMQVSPPFLIAVARAAGVHACSFPGGAVRVLVVAIGLLAVGGWCAAVPSAAQHVGAPRPADAGTTTHARAAQANVQSLAVTPASRFGRAAAGLAGTTDRGVVVADIDGQNGPDVLTTRIEDVQPEVILYLQQADGGFAATHPGVTGTSGGDIAVADVDGQHGPDLLVTGYDTRVPQTGGFRNPTATLYLQQADGSFAPANAGLTGVVQGSVSIADVDGQNGADLLITGRGANSRRVATLYLQQADGGFAAAGAGLTPVVLGSTSIADVDGQNGPDLLITGQDVSRRGTARLYLQQADGSFAAAGAGLTGVVLSATAIADVDGQHGPDLLMTGLTGFSDSDEPVSVLYLQQNDGSFAPAGAGLTGVESGAVAVADVDAQEGADLLVTGDDAAGTPTATLYLQQSDGGFAPADAGLTGVSRGAARVADIDEDGDSDLLIAGEDALLDAASTRLYVNQAVQPGTNRSPRAVESSYTFDRTPGADLRVRLEFGDPDGDRLSLSLSQGSATPNASFVDAGNGTGELQFVPDESQAGRTVTFEVAAADGRGGVASATVTVVVSSVMQPRSALLAGGAFGTAAVADVDGQHGLDVLASGDDADGTLHTTLYLQQADGRFAAAGAGLPGIERGASVLADVDGQHGPDVLLVGRDANLDPIAQLYLQQSDGGFAAAGAGLTGVQEGAASVADVDGQHGPDLLLTGMDDTGTPTATLYLQQSDGGFAPAGAGLTGRVHGAARIAEVDGQHGPDLLLTGVDATGTLSSTLYLQQSDGSFVPAGAGLTGTAYGAARIAEVDGQHGPDLLLTGLDDTNTLSATLYLQQADGGFAPAGTGLTGVTYSSASIADVDGQHGPDLLISGAGTGFLPSTTLYLQQPDGRFATADAGLSPVLFGASVLADLDRDGDPDPLLLGGGRTIANGGFPGDVQMLYDNRYDPAEAVATADVPAGASTQSFAGTGAAIDFSSGTAGPGRALVVKYGFAPGHTTGIPADATVRPYRFSVQTGPGLSVGTGTRLRLDVSTLADLPAPEDVRLYRRNPPGDGYYRTSPGASAFTEIPAEDLQYDLGSGELVATVDGFSEIAVTAPAPIALTAADAAFGTQSVRVTWGAPVGGAAVPFDVQRRTVGGWTTVGTVAAADTTVTQDYRFVDRQAPYESDSLTYRLRQRAAAGTTRYTAPFAATRGTVSQLRLLGTFPNPARSRATVRFAVPATSDAADVSLRLYDLLGRRVRTVRATAPAGRHELQLNTAGLASGVYFLRLTAGGVARTQKLTVVQ